MEIGHLLHAGQNPNIAMLAHYADASFVNVQQAAVTQSFQEIVIGARIVSGHRGLELVSCVAGDAEAEQLRYAGSNTTLRQPEFDVLIDRVCCESRTVFVGGPIPVIRIEGAST